MDNSLVERISRLSELTKSELGSRFRQTFGKSPSSRASRELLSLAIADKLQEEIEGGLSEKARRQLNRKGSRSMADPRIPKQPPIRFKAGTRFIRNWRGDTHQVTVLDCGFDYQGRLYNSLSEIARRITGTRWSGPAFFGLKKIQAQEVVHA